MPRFKLTIEYDGTAFYGWQVQKNYQTIQGKFFDACKNVFQTQTFEFYGGGRTDAGVHALGQVAHLDVKTNLKLVNIQHKLNDELPAGINILSIEAVDKNFHARHSAIARSYIYHIARRRTAFGKKYVWWIKDELNTDLMQQAAKYFIGMHNYSSFGTTEKEDGSKLVDITAVDILFDNENILIRIQGSHFLWKQVRRMVGVLVEVGRKQIAPEHVKKFLETYSQVPAKFTAPPSGLYLENIFYEGDDVTLERMPLLNL